MVKIKNKKKLKWCLVNYNPSKIIQKWVASYLGITPQRFRQLYTKYKMAGLVPVTGINLGSSKKGNTDYGFEFVVIFAGLLLAVSLFKRH